MQNASAADDDDTEYEADGEDDECNENATIMAIPRTRARIRLLGLICCESHRIRSPWRCRTPPRIKPTMSSQYAKTMKFQAELVVVEVVEVVVPTEKKNEINRFPLCALTFVCHI